ncbi:hypothetical protein ARMGADRAFT_1008730 [Armillaria gallica]|uniref:Uncharacterized protein n=1 Tax=Armillaria gallica TaxID=47427 RepID=A0A2H3ECT4_ARMGA|nr:hypothetical protein ARMGADRAFT_1008730 [Armillaria gallica]
MRFSVISWVWLAPMKLSFKSFDNFEGASTLHLLKAKFIKEEQLIMHCNKCLQVL